MNNLALFLIWSLCLVGHEVSLAQQYGLIGVCSIPFFLIAGAGGVVFWVLGASLFFITGGLIAADSQEFRICFLNVKTNQATLLSTTMTLWTSRMIRNSWWDPSWRRSEICLSNNYFSHFFCNAKIDVHICDVLHKKNNFYKSNKIPNDSNIMQLFFVLLSYSGS